MRTFLQCLLLSMQAQTICCLTWTSRRASQADSLLSMMQGYPGTVMASVQYILTDSNEVIITFEANTSATTPIGMAQNTHFNLDGFETNRTVMDHVLQINGQGTSLA